MKKLKIKTYDDKMIFSVSLASLYTFIKMFNKVDGTSNYITSNNIIQSVGELIPVISRENFTDSKYKTFIRNVAICTGCFTSLIISIRTNGKKCFIEFCFNLLSCTSTILIIDKLKKLNMIDGISISILIGFIFQMVKTISGPILTVLIQLTSCLLFILLDLTIFNMCYGYDKLEYKNICNYNFAMSICESIFGNLGSLLMPLLLFALNFSDIKKIKKDFNSNNLLDGIRLKEHEKQIFKVVAVYSIKIGCLGGLMLLLNSFIGVFPAYRLGLLASSLLTLSNDIKAYFSLKKISKISLV